MTQRLYYDDPYLTSFSGKVLECREKEGKWAIRLDRSAFYPTSGGQPYDTGRLGSANIQDVYVENADVWHVTDAPLEVGAEVRGEIDWERRFDHMQQHAGEHMLANAVYRLMNGTTIGLHLGADISTIDVVLPGGDTNISAEMLRRLEDDVNEKIQRDVTIRQWFPDPEELARLPLRKKPTVDEHIRVVQIGDLEFCACGGTHPSTAGQIGLVKIVDARPSRGKLRLGFVCGKRAFELLRRDYDILHQAANSVSAATDDVPAIILQLQKQLREARWQAGELRKKLLITGEGSMIESAQLSASGVRVVCGMVDGDMDAIRELANHIVSVDGRIALIGAQSGEGYVYVAARSKDVKAGMGAIVTAAAKATGGKGGGRPDFAQGGGAAEMFSRMLAESLAY
jgi:alanyl-tRNA synthetase